MHRRFLPGVAVLASAAWMQAEGQLVPPGTIIVSDNDDFAVLAVDPASGDRGLVYSGLRDARTCAIDDAGRLFVQVETSTMVIDLATGVTCTAGGEEECPSPPPYWWRPRTADGRALYATGSYIISMDPYSSSDDGIVSGFGRGSGPHFENIGCVCVAPDGTIYAGGGYDEVEDDDGTVTPGFGVVYRVDPLTGDRTVIWGPETGSGPHYSCAVDAIAIEADGRLVIVHGGALFRLDPATGDLALVSGGGRGHGVRFDYIAGIAIVPPVAACAGAHLAILEGKVILCSAEEVYGGSIALMYDPNEIAITSVRPTDELIAVLGGPPEYMNALLDPFTSCPGKGFGLAWTNSFSSPEAIPPGAGRALFVLECAAGPQAQAESHPRLRFAEDCVRSREDAPAIENRVGVAYGRSIVATTHDGSTYLGPFFRRGEVNYDGSVDIGDAISILLHLFGRSSSQCQEALDANDDGGIDISDVVSLLQWLFDSDGAASVPPYPGPWTCGPDPAPDRLNCQISTYGCW